MPSDLEKSIIKTIAYFDVFNFPLTTLEVWKWLYRPREKYTLQQVREILDTSSWLKGRLTLQEGFFSLKNRDNIFLLRKQNNNWAERKFQKTVRIVKIFSHLPFVKMVAVCNNLSYSNSRESSDIDLFVVSKKNQIWLARFFCLLILKILDLRPKEEDRRDKFCLSFFIDENYLDMKTVMLGQHDVHFVYWLSQFLPIYDPEKIYEKLLTINNWQTDYLPNVYPSEFINKVEATSSSIFFSKIINFLVQPPVIAHWLYNKARLFQVKIIGRNLQAMVNIDTRVIINEHMLKFHSNDRRDQYFHEWKDLVKKLLEEYE
jgi:hypothetical protein